MLRVVTEDFEALVEDATKTGMAAAQKPFRRLRQPYVKVIHVRVPHVEDVEAWRARAEELAAHSLDTLIIDRHSWGAVRRPQERVRGRLLVERSGTLTTSTVARHFEGREVHHLLVVSGYVVIPHAGRVHAWIGFALEPPGPVNELDGQAISWEQTRRLADSLEHLGLSALIEHADGLGTYHIWLVLRRNGLREWDEISSIPAVDFARRLLDDLELPRKALSLSLPLPGRHMTQPRCSQFWVDGEWVRGPGAVEALLSMPTNPVSLLHDVCTRYLVRADRTTRQSPDRLRQDVVSNQPEPVTRDHLAAPTIAAVTPPPASASQTPAPRADADAISTSARVGTSVDTPVAGEPVLWPFVTVSILLLLALFPLPYAYYTLLRWSVVGCAAYGAFTLDGQRTAGKVRLRQEIDKVALGDAYEDNRYILASAVGTALDRWRLRRRFVVPVMIAADVKGVRMYDLRHSCATFSLDLGANPRVVSDRLGHSDPAFTMKTYVHALQGSQAGVTKLLVNAFPAKEEQPDALQRFVQ